jgi:hypothetical protein
MISQEIYHTEQYERSLLLFNRNHPLATGALQQDSPVLQAGQPVYIPPTRILEKYYGAAPSNTASPAQAPAPSRGLDRPDPPGTMPASPPRADPVPPVKPVRSPEGLPLYRVHEGGEMVREIAHRTLGDGDRWVEVYSLNRSFDPKKVIPAGSLVRLPRDARVDPQDAP